MKFTICPVTTNKYSDDGTVQNDGYTKVIFSPSIRWFSLLTLIISYHTPFTYSFIMTPHHSLSAQWRSLKGRPDDIRKGLEKSGITYACRSDFTVDDNPFVDLVSI